MKYVEAFALENTSHYVGGPLGNMKPGEGSLFLAGGISNCYDWQAEVAAKLVNTDLVVLNPRRKNFPMNDPKAAAKQIEWEYDHLNRATMILFWFAPETLCPITLFEYGKWLVRNKPLFVGCHPEYKRLQDVQVQTALERPFQKVYTDLEELVGSVILHSPQKWHTAEEFAK